MTQALRTVSRFPYRVDIKPHVWVPMHDGTKLSVKLWVPRGHEEGERFPVVLEAIPYRKDDICLADDSKRMAYIAGHGYVCARLDLRGSGDSEGVLYDEYCEQEQDDLCEVIAWLAALPCSTGKVGMTGISWSGFNSLQAAAKRPPALRAIITVCSTDDRYDNDVHYMGGSPLAFYMNWWGAIMHEFNMRPPDPAVVGEGWERIWRERLAQNTHLTDKWLAHQRRDSCWKTGSVCEDYSAICCPVLAVGGWADGYTDAIVRLLDNLGTCAKAIIGPWGHVWPERPVPGPAIGFLQESLRWWDHWLKGIDNGVQADPTVRYYLQDACRLEPDLQFRPGRWMQTGSLTQRGHDELILSADGHLVAPQADALGSILSHSSPLICGTQVDTWLPMGSNIDLPSEQTPDDERSLCFDSDVLEDDLAIVGNPVLKLRVAADKPRAFAFVRLCDVYPDGTSQLITRGNLNLTHRGSHEFPEPLEPGEFYNVEIPLKAVAQVIPAGHKVRIAISTSYWIWIWPSPEVATITVDCAASRLMLPVAGDGDVPLVRGFLGPEVAKGEEPKVIPTDGYRAFRTSDEASGKVVYTRITDDFDKLTTPAGMTVESDKVASYTIYENDPLSARMDTLRHETFTRDGWEVDVEVTSAMECDAEDFIVTTRSKASYNGKQVMDETRSARIPRDLN